MTAPGAGDRLDLRDWFCEQVAPLQTDVRTLLEAGVLVRDPKLPSLCAQLLKLWPALWTFVTVPGVEPTNNRAEQAIRPAVLWRKGSFGTQSADGNHFVERMLSVTATCKQQGRALLDYLTAVCTAVSLGLLAYTRSAALAALAIVLLIAPHLVGGPLPPTHETAVPMELHARFVNAVYATNLVFWAVLGALTAVLRQRFRAGEDLSVRPAAGLGVR